MLPARAPIVITKTSRVDRVACSTWAADSSTLTVTISGDAPQRGPFDVALGIEEEPHRAVFVAADPTRTAGELDVLLDARGRPRSLAIYTNTSSIARVTSAAAETPAEPGDVALFLDFDANGIATIDAEVTMELDPKRRTLTLFVRAPGSIASPRPHWVAFADGLAIGVDAAGDLAAFRCEEISPEDFATQG
jgi:hypothetical protein